MAEELLTVQEAADRLGTTKTRLRRLLAGPSWKGYLSESTRPTRTGVRTATVLPASLLPALENALRERDRSQARPAELSVETADLFRRVIAEQEARISALEAQVEDMRAVRDQALRTVEQEQERAGLLLAAVERERERGALPPPPRPWWRFWKG